MTDHTVSEDVRKLAEDCCDSLMGALTGDAGEWEARSDTREVEQTIYLIVKHYFSSALQKERERVTQKIDNAMITEREQKLRELERGVQLGLDRARRAVRGHFKPADGTYHPLEIIIMYRDTELEAALTDSGPKPQGKHICCWERENPHQCISCCQCGKKFVPKSWPEQAREIERLSSALRDMQLNWTRFYRELPDGEYDNLGEMRQASIHAGKALIGEEYAEPDAGRNSAAEASR